MESLDANVVQDNNSFNNGEINMYLMETVKWGKFLAIMGYIAIGFLLLAGLGVMVMGGVTSEMVPGMGGMNMGVFGLIYIVIGGFYFFPVYYLHQFSLKMKQGLTSHDSQSITTGFQNLKSLFKFMGIFTIVILSIYVLIILGAILVGLGSAL